MWYIIPSYTGLSTELSGRLLVVRLVSIAALYILFFTQSVVITITIKIMTTVSTAMITTIAKYLSLRVLVVGSRESVNTVDGNVDPSIVRAGTPRDIKH